MADSYGFHGEEEWGRVQQYLKSHGGWQLEQVGVTGESAWSLVVNVGRLPYQIVGRLYIGQIFHISGERHGQLPLREHEGRSWREGGKQQEPSLLPYSVHVLASGRLVGQ